MADFRINDYALDTYRIMPIFSVNDVNFDDIGEMLSKSSWLLNAVKSPSLGSTINVTSSLVVEPGSAVPAEATCTCISDLLADATRLPWMEQWSSLALLYCRLSILIPVELRVTAPTVVYARAERIVFFDQIHMDAVSDYTDTYPSSFIVLRNTAVRIDGISHMIGGTWDIISNIAKAKIPTLVSVAGMLSNINFWAGSSYALRIGKPAIFDMTDGRIAIQHDPAL